MDEHHKGEPSEGLNSKRLRFEKNTCRAGGHESRSCREVACNASVLNGRIIVVDKYLRLKKTTDVPILLHPSTKLLQKRNKAIHPLWYEYVRYGRFQEPARARER
jgi:hypothetical protein